MYAIARERAEKMRIARNIPLKDSQRIYRYVVAVNCVASRSFDASSAHALLGLWRHLVKYVADAPVGAHELAHAASMLRY